MHKLLSNESAVSVIKPNEQTAPNFVPTALELLNRCGMSIVAGIGERHHRVDQRTVIKRWQVASFLVIVSTFLQASNSARSFRRGAAASMISSRSGMPSTRLQIGPAAAGQRPLCRAAFGLALPPRGTNERSRLYRIRPSSRHTGRFRALSAWEDRAECRDHELALGQHRWNPVPMPSEPACSSRKPDKNVT
ncbi:hypothetical protein MPL3365_170278 [Mesorhizobium plurifarium]|uniref:Homogentisate 1,2-dioxygenase N-terminal domain-containing protein n=1 Tax=Mesorhizobium plurifarium TaxID=69974 RepID=A0A090FZE8_MESPL|nr:hypothetical protein MPL3365_170278 [Mesorhizobium plurifarium]